MDGLESLIATTRLSRRRPVIIGRLLHAARRQDRQNQEQFSQHGTLQCISNDDGENIMSDAGVKPERACACKSYRIAMKREEGDDPRSHTKQHEESGAFVLFRVTSWIVIDLLYRPALCRAFSCARS
jgi:hypothetical protein